MKTAVAIVLIVAGVFLIALPPISDYLWRADVVRLMEKGSTNVVLSGRMQTPYPAFCYMAGVAMIAVAVVSSMRRPSAAG